MQITRRPAVEADREFARAVHHAAYEDVVRRQYGRWELPEQNRFFDASWKVPGWYEIILCDGVPCGYVCLEYHSSGWHYLREIVILPAYQNLGIGTLLIRQMMARATHEGTALRLQTHHHNRAANLYRRLGFIETGKTPTHIEFDWLPPGVTAPPKPGA